MNMGKTKVLCLALSVLLLTPVVACSAFQNSGESSTGAAKNVLASDYAVVELGNIWLFDEKNSTVGISYTLRPGPDTEYDKYYDIKLVWGEHVVSGLLVRFRSQEHESSLQTMVLEGRAAERFIELLTETKEYQRLLRAFENLQAEKRRFREKEEEMAYNLFWRGEAPSYDEYKKAMAQLEDMDAREKQIIQEFYEFPYSARLPSSFVSSLELVVEVR